MQENDVPTLGEDTAAAMRTPQESDDGGHRGGGVYTMTNGPSGNAVQAFARDSDGNLSPLGPYSTGGYGTGAALGSQGSLRLTPNSRLLAVVSAGSDQATAFRVQRDGALNLLNTLHTGGRYPISTTLTDRIAYVLNAGGTPNIAGFAVGQNGLHPLWQSLRRLSPLAVGPAEVRFNASGRRLDVPAKFSNTIDIFSVDRHASTSGPVPSPSAGIEPFGSVWQGDDRLLVTEAVSGSVSLYAVLNYDRLHVVAASVPDFQVAPCWIDLTKDGRYAYVANTGSGTISSYRVGRDSLTLLESVAGIIGGSPIDLALSRDSEFLYALNGTAIAGFRVNSDGSLDPLLVMPVAPGSLGLAAF